MINVNFKKCIKCNENKPSSEFWKSKMTKDGLRSYCKTCNKLSAKQWVNNNPQKVALSRRKYKVSHQSLIKILRHQWNVNNPQKVRVYQNVKYAVSKGNLIRKPCEICGSLKVHGHHNDYNKPLEVVWLCLEHHATLHKLLAEREK